VDSNATIKAKLEAEGYATTDVVALQTNVDGSVIVVVDDAA
jgi:iron uptake system EfeUOB component EfeO/EfeM